MNENFRGKGASPPTIFGTRKVESLGYRMVKKIAEKFNRLSRARQRHRQTDRRQTELRRQLANVNASSRPPKTTAELDYQAEALQTAVCSVAWSTLINKSSSEDEIANVNFL